MEFDEKRIFINPNMDDSNDEINLIEIFEKYGYYWRWFILGVLLSLSLAYFYMRYTHDIYQVSSMIFVDDEESGGLSSEISAFEDLGVFGGDIKSSIINETGVLKSRTLMKKVVKDLGVNITYYEIGRVLNTELYGDEVPFRINFFIKDSILFNLRTMFIITVKSGTKFELKEVDKYSGKECVFGKNITTGFGEINILPSNIKNIEIGESILVKINPIREVANYYKQQITFEPEARNSSLLILTLRDRVKQKAKDIIDNLVIQYNDDVVEFKKLVAENTDRFVNDRLIDISLDLSSVDKGVEEFKTKNRLTNMDIEAGLDLESNLELERRILELNSQIKLVDYISKHIKNNKESLIPANLGIEDAATNENTTVFNRLLLERNRIIKSSSKLNPTVINLEAQLTTLRMSIEQGLTNLRSSLNFSLTEARNQEYRINTKRKAAPQQEREFQDIKRKQQIIESLYLYLLQKREENAISLGIPVPNAKVIDFAEGSDTPVYPKPFLIYFISGVLGLLTPFIIISFKFLFDNKVHSKDDIEKVVKAPIIGDIPKTRSEKKMIITDQNNSEIAESFRLLRTNVDFMLPSNNDTPKTIFITSTLSGEGKTFIAINLAKTMALLDKNVLLIGADIRKPKIASYLNISPEIGLTNFLTDYKLNEIEIIHHDSVNNMDVIFSGEIPPNPSELLLNERFDDILAYGKEHYDYVIIDTSPVNMVTDTLLLGHHADLFIYIVRAEFLDKRLLEVPQMMYDNKRLPNMAMLINATESEKKGYGYGYGYGYREVESRKSWWKF